MWCFQDIEYYSFYARRISMPKSFNGKRAYVYCYRLVAWFKNIELGWTRVLSWFGMSNTVS
jgi:hypothetical protein